MRKQSELRGGPGERQAGDLRPWPKAAASELSGQGARGTQDVRGGEDRDRERLVLGVETSCDETAASVVADGRRILANVVSSQVALHQRFGGVVPEVASRRHVELILPVIDTALRESGVRLEELCAIAVTRGPGLVGSLLVGLAAAKALAYASGVDLIGVNHIEGHIYANFLAHAEVEPPLVCLTVSGGHTDLLYMPQAGTYQVLGRTRDDAAGEAFDKVGRMLGLPYPAGPHIDRLAVAGDPQAFALPRGLAEGFDFSFSGLKTAAVNLLHNARQRGEEISVADFAASLQEAIVDVLVAKTLQAVDACRVQVVIMSGGVAANTRLRRRLGAAAAERGFRFFYPPAELCTDNAAMVASAGYFRWLGGDRAGLDLNAEPGLRLT